MVEELRKSFKFVLSQVGNFAGGLCARRRQHRRELSRQRLQAFDGTASIKSENDRERDQNEVVDESGVLSEDASLCASECSRCECARVKRKTEELHEELNAIASGDVSRADSLAREMQGRNMLGFDTLELIEKIESKRKRAGGVQIDSEVDMQHLLNLVDKDVEKEKAGNSPELIDATGPRKNSKKRLLSGISSKRQSSSKKKSSVFKHGNDSNLMVNDHDSSEIDELANPMKSSNQQNIQDTDNKLAKSKNEAAN